MKDWLLRATNQTPFVLLGGELIFRIQSWLFQKWLTLST